MKKIQFKGFDDPGRTYSATFSRKLEDGTTELYDVADIKIDGVFEVDDAHAAKLLKAHEKSGPMKKDKAGNPTGEASPAFVAVK